MIGTTVALHDINDAEGFCAHFINKSRIRLSAEDREELMAEGLAILSALAAKFERHRDGYEQAGTFSGYAGSLLPKRLDDAYHKLHPEHRKIRGVEGKRTYEYGSAPRSIFAEDMPEIVASAYIGPHEYDQLPDCPTTALASMAWEPPGQIIEQALKLVPGRYRMGSTARNVTRLIDEGFGTDEIARQLRIDRRDVSDTQAAVASAVWAVQNTRALA